MVLMKSNVHELVAMVELAHALGLDRLDVAHLTVLVPEMDCESLRHEPARADAALRAARARRSVGVSAESPADDVGSGAHRWSGCSASVALQRGLGAQPKARSTAGSTAQAQGISQEMVTARGWNGTLSFSSVSCFRYHSG